MLDILRMSFAAPTRDAGGRVLYDAHLSVAIDWKHSLRNLVIDFLAQAQLFNKSDEFTLNVDIVSGQHWFSYKERSAVVTNIEDLHVVIHVLNELIKDDYEIRCDISGYGGDSVSYLLLPLSYWRQLVEEFGEPLVQARFYRIAERPSLFQDGGYFFTEEGEIAYFNRSK
jgi:hypothetical protein